MQQRHAPPARRSPDACGMVNCGGALHLRRCSGSVHASHTSATGASKIRSRTSVRSSTVARLLAATLLLLLRGCGFALRARGVLGLQFAQVCVEAIEPRFPEL